MTSDPMPGANSHTTDGALAFVVASPRSGTTWLKEALRAHPDVHCTERRLFGPHADIVHDRGAARARVRITLDQYVESLCGHADFAGASERVLGAMIDTMIRTEREAAGKRIIVDKVTPYVGTAPTVVRRINEYFPRARVILLLRDGRDVLVSGVMHWLTKSLAAVAETPHASARRAYFLGQGGELDRLCADAEVDEWAATWRGPIDAVETAALGASALRIRYEGMLDDQAEALRSIFKFLGADAGDRVISRCVEASSFERMSGGRPRGVDAPGQHVRKGIAGDWANLLTSADGERFHERAGDLLLSLGYESDPRWFEALPERLGGLRHRHAKGRSAPARARLGQP